MPRSRYIRYAVFFMIAAGVLTACAPETYKARIDMTSSGGIVWPGVPEKPRIRYLWSLQNVGAEDIEGRRGFLDLLSGRTTDDVTDPQTSNILLRPQGVFADENRLYIADPGAARVTVIDRKTMDVFHITEAGEEGILFPRGVAADQAGTIYVSDSDLRKVAAYSPDGKFKYLFDGDFRRPSGIAIDNVRNIVYVVDTDAHSVHICGTDGKIKGGFGKMGRGDGEFFYPTYVNLDKKGNLYVTDFLNFRIQMFTPDGAFLKSIGTLGDTYDTLDKPKGVATDPDGNVYIVDGAQHMVKIFSQEGKLLLFFGEKGENEGDFYLPTGIFIDSKGIIYVADTLNMRVQAFQFLGGD